MPLNRADSFFGAVLIVAGVIGSLSGGLLGTWWQRRTPAGYALLLTSSIALALPFSFCAILAGSAGLSMAFLAASIFLLFFITGPVNTLILETVPVNVREQRHGRLHIHDTSVRRPLFAGSGRGSSRTAWRGICRKACWSSRQRCSSRRFSGWSSRQRP